MEERFKDLETIENDITTSLQCAGKAIYELSKDRTSIKQVENQSYQFLKSLSDIQCKLTDQINYLTQVTTSLPHENSGYAAQKELDMAQQRVNHVHSRVQAMEHLKKKYLQDQ